MIITPMRRFIVLVACLAASGCASPEPNTYTLQPVAGTPSAAAHGVIEVRRPGLAGYLDRSDILLKDDGYQLHINSQSRWGEPLADMVERVLSQNLQQRLPGANVFGQDGAITADPDLRVEVDVQRFDPAAGGDVTLQAGVAIEQGISHAPMRSFSVSLSAPAPQPGPAGLAAAMSTLLGQLADDIAAAVERPRS